MANKPRARSFKIGGSYYRESALAMLERAKVPFVGSDGLTRPWVLHLDRTVLHFEEPQYARRWLTEDEAAPLVRYFEEVLY